MSFSNLPRAHIDPIEAPLVALRLILMMVDPKASAETLVLTLDHRRCGVSITHVSGTDDPDAVLGVIDALAESARSSLGVADHAGSPTLSSSSGLWSAHRSHAHVSSVAFRHDGRADQSCVVGVGSALWARRCAGDRRSPALRNRRRSSRLSTAVAPAPIIWARYDSRMS